MPAIDRRDAREADGFLKHREVLEISWDRDAARPAC